MSEGSPELGWMAEPVASGKALGKMRGRVHSNGHALTQCTQDCFISMSSRSLEKSLEIDWNRRVFGIFSCYSLARWRSGMRRCHDHE